MKVKMLEELVSRIDGKPGPCTPRAWAGVALALHAAGCCPHSARGPWLCRDWLLREGGAAHPSEGGRGGGVAPFPFLKAM